MLLFAINAFIGGHRSRQSTRNTCRRRVRPVACASDTYGNNAPKSTFDAACSYCNDELSVVCPVCEGEGRISRSILCYYCKGRKIIPCPVCAVDDPYEFSYSAITDPTLQIEEDEYEEDV